MITRRKFLSTSFYAGTGLMLGSGRALPASEDAMYLGVNPFIKSHTDAVFIMRTEIDRKTNGEAIKATGLDFGRSVFNLTDNPDEGVPLSDKIVIKPNLTCRQSGRDIYTVEGSMGIVTDANFVEGIIESIKEQGFAGNQFYIREVNCPEDLDDGGYTDMAQRTGIDLQCNSTPAIQMSPDKIQWVDVPDGVWFRKIPYLWPVNAPDTFLINIAKFKAHSMGLTLCAKNLQGTIAMNYQAHCTAYGKTMTGVNTGHLNPDAFRDIQSNYNKHLIQGIPRWKRPGDTGGIWQETWASRCLDNNSVTHAGLHIIEGIYGRDGDFLDGPGTNNLATDYMTNYIIFGINPFYVDIVGHYLGGHEPGNFGLFHMARERGMITTFNPKEIPVYSWDTLTGASLTAIESLTRYPLKTKYLLRDYDGQGEDYWHLVNEPYDYDLTGIDDHTSESDVFYFTGISPNPVTTSSEIGYHLPFNSFVSVDIVGPGGQIVQTLRKGFCPAGDYTVNWSSSGHSSGLYICRVTYNGTPKTVKLMVSH